MRRNHTADDEHAKHYPLIDEPEHEGPGSGRFSARLAAAFVGVAIMTVLIAVLMLSLVWGRQFELYRKSNMENIANAVATKTAAIYAQVGEWRYESLLPVVEYSDISGLAVRIVTPNGSVLADSSGLDGRSDLGDVGVLSQLRGSAFTAEPQQKVSAPVVVSGEQIATVHVWSYGQNTLLSQSDLDFRDATYWAVGIAALFAVFFASVSGLAFASMLVDPINKITSTVAAIRSGDRTARTGMAGGDEISELGKAFDDMADAIEKDRQLERRLTSDVAHELRTPLMAIQATVEAMQDGVLPCDEVRLGSVSDETVRLSRLVDAILELTRLERGSLPFEMRPLDMGELVESAVVAHGALFEASGLSLTSSFAPGLLVMGDSDRLLQAVGNLLSNAARYTPEGGSVEVAVSTDGCDAVVAVSDTGIGIDEADLERVFSRFWRADGARNRSSGGLGIGLSVTREIVDRHAGTIRAERRSAGGSKFTVRIPLIAPTASEPCPKGSRGSLGTRVRESGLFGRGQTQAASGREDTGSNPRAVREDPPA